MKPAHIWVLVDRSGSLWEGWFYRRREAVARVKELRATHGRRVQARIIKYGPALPSSAEKSK